MNRVRPPLRCRKCGSLTESECSKISGFNVLRLDFTTREVLRLRRDGHSIGFIAEWFDCSRQTIWRRLQQARKVLTPVVK